MTKRTIRLLAAIAALPAAAAACSGGAAEIRGALVDISGSPWTGSIVLKAAAWPHATASSISVAAGVLDGCIIAGTYEAAYLPATTASGPGPLVWTIPPGGATYDYREIEGAGPAEAQQGPVALSRLSSGGATAGQALTWDGNTYAPATGGSGGATGATGPAGTTGPAGAPGATGPAGTLAQNGEYTTSLVMNSGYCPAWLGTFTGSAALTFTMSAPTTGCSIGLQNNATQPMTVNVTTNGLTMNGQTANGTIPPCATPANGCKVVVIKANSTTSWDMSSPGADGAQGATGAAGATGPAGPTGPGGSGGTSTIASGSTDLGTSAIASGACDTTVTATATGTAATDNFIADFNADPTSTTGYQPTGATGMLTIIKWPTTNTVNFKVCNNTQASITPGAVRLNWRVVR